MSANHPTDRISFRKRIGTFFKKFTLTGAPVRFHASARNDQLFHFVISAVQEDEIRESFLVEKIRGYTQSLSESDFESVVQELGEYDKNDTDQITHQFSCEDDDRESENGFISVPLPGEQYQGVIENTENSNRKAPNGCAICLSSFETDDRVTWSSNTECTHVFHESCIIDWLNASGRRHLRRRRRQSQHEGVLNYANDPLRKITRFPMPCPCCRQVFVLCSEATDDDPTEQRASTTTQLTNSHDATVQPSSTGDGNTEQPGPPEFVAESTESNGDDGPQYPISCVELSASDETADGTDGCSYDSITLMAPLASQIEV